jgi:hypothetical protein
VALTDGHVENTPYPRSRPANPQTDPLQNVVVDCTSFLGHLYAGCLKFREFRIQSVVGDHFRGPNMEIKKKKIRTPPTKIHWSESALFELRFLQIQAEKFSVYCYLWCT